MRIPNAPSAVELGNADCRKNLISRLDSSEPHMKFLSNDPQQQKDQDDEENMTNATPRNNQRQALNGIRRT